MGKGRKEREWEGEREGEEKEKEKEREKEGEKKGKEPYVGWTGELEKIFGEWRGK